MLQDKQQNSATECPVCLDENVNDAAYVVRLDCGHSFCYGCITKCQFEGTRPTDYQWGRYLRLLSIVSRCIAEYDCAADETQVFLQPTGQECEY